jgi:methyl-accepting chemotaxis protein
LNTRKVNKIGIESDNILKKGIDLNNTGADMSCIGFTMEATPLETSRIIRGIVVFGVTVVPRITTFNPH